MDRRTFLQAVGASAPAALPAGEVAGHAGATASAEPRVLVYDDGRHAAPLYQFEQRQRLGVHGLGRSTKAAMAVQADVMLARDIGDRPVQQRLRRALVRGRHRPEIHAQHRMIWHDIVRPAAVDPGRIAGKALAARRLQPQRQIRRR